MVYTGTNGNGDGVREEVCRVSGTLEAVDNHVAIARFIKGLKPSIRKE